MSLPVRVTTLLVAFALVVGGMVFIVLHYIGGGPPTVNYTGATHNHQVNVVLQEDPQNNSATEPEWVSYYVQDPSSKKWVHTTLFTVPKNTKVNVTILGYDGCTPLRNNFFSKVFGTMSGTVNVDGKPMSVIDSWAHCSVGHTFAIPSLGLFVPVASPGASATLCSVSPCQPTTSSGKTIPHSVEKFSFMTPDHGGVFRWQCFVPCGGGFLDGNSGPMQTIGYMMGEMTVTA